MLNLCFLLALSPASPKSFQAKQMRIIVCSQSSFPIWKTKITVTTFCSTGATEDTAINTWRCSDVRQIGPQPRVTAVKGRFQWSSGDAVLLDLNTRKRLASAVAHHSSLMSQKRHLPVIKLVQYFKQIWNVFSLEVITLLIWMHLMFAHTLQIWSAGPVPTKEKDHSTITRSALHRTE